MNSNTGTLVRRQNSFGRDLGDPGGQGQCGSQNQTPTSFRTLPRINKTCEVFFDNHFNTIQWTGSFYLGLSQSISICFCPSSPMVKKWGSRFLSRSRQNDTSLTATSKGYPKAPTCPVNISSGLFLIFCFCIS